jgi:hypothetical protein
MGKMNKRKFTFSVPGIRTMLPGLSVKIPGLSRLRIPLPGGIYLGGGRLILVSLSAVALGFLASMFLLISKGEQQITWPMLGAVYEAPSLVGARAVDREFPAEVSQTLEIRLPAGTRLDEVRFTDINLGKSGLTNAFTLSGTSTTDLIVIDELIIRNSEFPTMSIDYAEIYQLHATSSVIAAGHTFTLTTATTTDVTVSSGRGAISYVAEDMTVDRIILTQVSSGDDVVIDRLILDGVSAWTGAFDADYIHVGTLTLENVKIGDDADINSADLTIGTNGAVNINSVLDGVQEEPIQIR